MIYERFKKWFNKTDTTSKENIKTIKEIPIILPKIKYDIRDILKSNSPVNS